ncbi:MAG: arginine--tRNA ligase, partial [Verrucomicrobia bacterium]|nr:arginine--tRNA ligase [Verrucomicrobiota bacterium]
MSTTFSDRIASRLADALARTPFAGEVPAGFAIQVEPTQNRQFGDYQSNAAMILAKSLRKNPREVAGAVAAAFDGSGLCGTPEIAGPGFINFRLTNEAMETRGAELMADEARLGVAATDAPRTIVLDFSAPNVAKPMHVGHIRSTILGDG